MAPLIPPVILPVALKIPGGLNPERSLFMEGTTMLNAKWLEINLQSGPSTDETDDIALKLFIYLHKDNATFTVNSKYKGQWHDPKGHERDRLRRERVRNNCLGETKAKNDVRELKINDSKEVNNNDAQNINGNRDGNIDNQIERLVPIVLPRDNLVDKSTSTSDLEADNQNNENKSIQNRFRDIQDNEVYQYDNVYHDRVEDNKQNDDSNPKPGSSRTKDNTDEIEEPIIDIWKETDTEKHDLPHIVLMKAKRDRNEKERRAKSLEDSGSATEILRNSEELKLQSKVSSVEESNTEPVTEDPQSPRESHEQEVFQPVVPEAHIMQQLYLMPGHEFKMVFECLSNGYVVTLNDELFCAYPHRVDYTLVSHIYIDGHLDLDALEVGGGVGPDRAIVMELYPPMGWTDNIVILTDETVSATLLDSGEPWMVNAYEAWCPACRRLHAHWESVARDTRVKGAVKIGVVDCDRNEQMAEDFNVEYYPTIYYLGPGPKSYQSAEVYQGGRNAELIIRFILWRLDGKEGLPPGLVPRRPEPRTLRKLKKSNLSTRGYRAGGMGYELRRKSRQPHSWHSCTHENSTDPMCGHSTQCHSSVLLTSRQRRLKICDLL